MDLFLFFCLYFATIVTTRLVLWFRPKHAPKIGNFQMHHYQPGLLLVGLYFFFPWLPILAVGLGLFVDEVPLFFMFKGFDWPENHWKQYQSWQSVSGIVALSFLGYLLFVLVR